MAIPFNHYESSQPESTEPKQFGAAMQEILHTLMDHNVVRPIQDALCTRNEAVAISTRGVKDDDLMAKAYADYA